MVFNGAFGVIKHAGNIIGGFYSWELTAEFESSIIATVPNYVPKKWELVLHKWWLFERPEPAVYVLQGYGHDGGLKVTEVLDCTGMSLADGKMSAAPIVLTK